MTDRERIFLDSNILVYLIDINSPKRKKAEEFLAPEFLISTQVVSENVNVCMKKFKLSKEQSFAHGNALIKNFHLVTINQVTIVSAFEVSLKYNYSFWDSLIIASALQNNCTVLYSEDMSDGTQIDNKLIIINPFKNT